MTLAGPSVINLLVDIVAFDLTGASLYFVARQKPSHYPYLKSLLILVHVFFELIIVQDALRNVTLSAPLVADYTLFAASMVFVDVVLLTVIAYSVYVRPGGRGLAPRLKSLFGRWPHGVVLAAFILFIIAQEGYLILYRPFSVVELSSLGGALVYSPRFNTTYLVMTALTLVFFLAYPTGLLVRSGMAVSDPATKRRFYVLPFCWAGIGAEIFLFNGYLLTQGYDFIAVGYAIAAFLFGVTAAMFRRTSVLSTFFEPLKGVPRRERGAVKGVGETLDASMPVLLEVDPTAGYEPALAGLSDGKTASGGLVYVFTSRGSPTYNALAPIPGVRFYVMSSQVSYPTRSPKENELLVPQNDMAVLLDLLDKTLSSTAATPLALVFDSITDLVLYLGFESAYKFLKQANEIVAKPGVSAVYLMIRGAQDERTTNLVKSLFRMHAAFDEEGLRVTRGPRSQSPARE